MEKLYTDGGVVRSNPSPIGGSWAWCLIRDGKLVAQDSGPVHLFDLEVEAVSNNQTELIAALKALDAMPDNWEGELWTDSNVTRWRLHGRRSKLGKGMTVALLERLADTVRRQKRFCVKLCKGHPTKDDLFRGDIEGVPVSKWNVYCDALCKREAAKLQRAWPGMMARLRGTEIATQLPRSGMERMATV